MPVDANVQTIDPNAESGNFHLNPENLEMTRDPLLIGASFVTYMDEEERYERGMKLDQLWDRIEH